MRVGVSGTRTTRYLFPGGTICTSRWRRLEFRCARAGRYGARWSPILPGGDDIGSDTRLKVPCRRRRGRCISSAPGSPPQEGCRHIIVHRRKDIGSQGRLPSTSQTNSRAHDPSEPTSRLLRTSLIARYGLRVVPYFHSSSPLARKPPPPFHGFVRFDNAFHVPTP